MFELNGLQLAGIIVGTGILATLFGFVIACCLGVSGQCSREEEMRWPSSLDEGE